MDLPNGEAADLIADLSRALPLSFTTAEAYRKHLHRAGLRLAEFRDISENVQRSDRRLPQIRYALLTAVRT